jgi:hypothetical protein
MEYPQQSPSFKEAIPLLTRREILRRSGMGFGALAMAGILGPQQASAAPSPMGSGFPTMPKVTHLPGRAKHVIHVFLNGGMSHVDTFDPKPELTKRAGQMLPHGDLKTESRTGFAFPSPYRFQKHGQSGMDVSEIFPRLAQCVDDIAVVRSMCAKLPNHELSLMLMNCGDQRLVRPSMGSWVLYGMGTENQNLPGFVVLCPGGLPVAGAENWRSAFLPGIFQGTHVNSQRKESTDVIENLRNRHMSLDAQRRQVDLLQALNQEHLSTRPHEPELESRIQSIELAFRMQIEATDAFDVSKESEHVLRLYGEGVQNQQLLIARRLIERGVRFVQVWHGAEQPWDSHTNIEKAHRSLAGQCDQGIAALIIDLKQRGLLDETLIICGGEFGRTPTVQLNQQGSGASWGRDHNPWGFSLWLAGGGIKGGTVYGATDEFGFKAVENVVSVHDLHATILYMLGFDHELLTYRHAGRDFRLTDVEGSVVHDLIA